MTNSQPATFKNQTIQWWVWGLLFVIFVINVLPSGRLLAEALSDIAQAGQSSFWKVLNAPATWQATWHSFYTSMLATTLAVVLGAGLAFFIALSNIRAKSFWVFMFMLPMMIPPQVTALSWLQLMGPGSALLQLLGVAPALGSPQPLYSAWGIALLMGIQHAPLVFLSVRTSLLVLPKELIEAARLSGASQSRIMLDMVFPLCKNGILAGAAIAFVSALGNFGIPAMLGIPASYYVLPTLIYQKMADFGPLMLNEVSSLSVIVGLIAMFGVWVQHRFQAKIPLVGMPGKPLAFALGRSRIWCEAGLALIILVILVMPLMALVTSSLVPAIGVVLTMDNLSFSAYAQMLTGQGVTWRAFQNSMLLSVGAAFILACLALPLVYVVVRRPRRFYSVVLMLIDVPYALPGVVLAIACILLFAKPIPVVEISLYGSLGIILFAYLSRFLTVSLKPVHSSMMQLDVALEEAAQLCGASLTRRWRDIVFPLLAPAAFAGFLLVFLIAVNELTVSALLWSAGNETLGVLIFNLADGGETVLASAVAVSIVLMIAVLMICLSVVGRNLPKGVIPWRN
ncbi:MAG: iron ABC transporter permease [Advenella sp.]|nr:iron ABC transporter permease [Advenella sp.]